MPAQDTSGIKERIMSVIRIKGPSLPVHIAKETDLSILFASAFLSELFSEKRIRISNMKVGSSPLYFIHGQEPQLEKFAHHLKSKEKEAFEIIKSKNIIDDNIQDPAIRVALRAIKDFAIPFKKNDSLFWRYFTVPEQELIEKIPLKEKKPEKEEPIGENLDIFEAEEKKEIKESKKDEEKEILNGTQKKKSEKKTIKRKKITSKQNNKFFDRVKDYLSEKSIEITGIEGFNKNELFLKIKKNKNEILLVAYNKKKISEEELIKANKKAVEMDVSYSILCLGKPSKKTTSLINAAKNLNDLMIIE